MAILYFRSHVRRAARPECKAEQDACLWPGGNAPDVWPCKAVLHGMVCTRSRADHAPPHGTGYPSMQIVQVWTDD